MLGLRSSLYALFTAVSLSLATQSKADVIYQAFDETFANLTSKLPKLKQLGYDYVQVSPVVKSLDLPDWWARYQPIDLRVIESPLGNEDELVRLITEAHKIGLKVLVDAVLNHMADDSTRQSRLQFPEFGPQDFHYPERRCIDNYQDRYQVTQYWLCGNNKDHGLPDLNTSSPHVRDVHRRYLEKLMDLGVDGFRFDAMKHIESSYWSAMAPVTEGKFVYGEVIGENFSESNEYMPFMPITDFHLLRTLLGAFSLQGDMRSLYDPEGNNQALPADKAVVFARNHDTAMHPDFFNFGDLQDAILANAYLLARGRGITSVYRDDWESPFIKGAVLFHKAMKNAPIRIRPPQEICQNDAICSPRTTLFIERGSEGLAIINTANGWLDSPVASVSALTPGCYKDLVFGVRMQVRQKGDGQKWITNWAEQHRQGIHIGPRSALMFVKSSEKECLTQQQ